MKIDLRGWHRLVFSVLVLGLPAKAAQSQFEADVRPAADPSPGAVGHLTPTNSEAGYHPMHQQDMGNWYAPPAYGDDSGFSAAPRPAAGRIRGTSSGSRYSGFFGGADYLLIRPHFSEAIAFARGTQGPASMNMVQEPLDFDYESSLRATFGYRSEDSNTELRFTYWHIDSEVSVGAGNPGPGQFIVDPFGNMVGSAVVLDPGDARFGNLIGIGGDSIATTASVKLNVFDIDMNIAVSPRNPNWSVDFTAGVRIADIEQYYDSVIRDAGGTMLTRGDFTVDFVGAGPRLGSGIRRIFGHDRQFNLFAQGSGALLLGQYDLAFSNSVGAFSGTQNQSMTRLIPVVETEVGGSWRMTDRLTVAGGYLFQGWFDLGTSGGKFDGFFSGTDDANIMSFDGMFLRAEMAF